MNVRKFVMASLLCLLPAAGHAQSAQVAQPATHRNESVSLREQLMPAAAALQLQAPAQATTELAAGKLSAQPAAYRGDGTGYMIAGAALFVAGLIVNGDAGTVLILAGAGIGAYGLYLHFR